MSRSGFSELLNEHRDRIVARFVADVQRQELSPRGLSRSMLVDHIPAFLDDIVAELERVQNVSTSREAAETSETARQHGEQRWTLGYDLETLIREYGILRHSILSTAKDGAVELSIDEFDVFAKCLSVGVATAATAYGRYRDQELQAQKANLEFLAEAGQLLSSSLDYRSTLARLTGLVVPRLADWCAVHLEGQSVEQMPIAHVDPTKIELLRRIYRLYPPPNDSSHGYQALMRSHEPELVRAVPAGFLENSAQNAEHLSWLRQIDSCSWMIVPLRIQDRTFGALTLAYSDSGRHYDTPDLVLAEDLARRAAVAIDNAKLYELSQRERSRVEAATRAKDEFVAMVSHELRTPLNAVLGWLRLMRSGALDETMKARALDVIERNAEAQSQLVSDLLDISRIITGKIRINPSQMDMSSVVDMAIEGIRPAAEAKRIRIEAEIERGEAILRGDCDRLQQVAWNLLANAIKFTQKNGLVTVRLRRVDSDIELSVKDNGEGIEPDFLPHVFESFRQSAAGETRPHGGLGIGLSIAKHIVELHGGSIRVASAGKGHGATFVVRLPVSSLVSTTLGMPCVRATKQPAEGAALPSGLQSIRVLVVDDEPDARELVTFVLEGCGMEVRSAASVAAALSELSEYTPHVIVSDIGMPDQDGYFLVRSIRMLPDEEKKNVPMVALTAFARPEDRTRALVAGFNLHISKPVEPAALVQAVIDLAGQGRD